MPILLSLYVSEPVHDQAMVLCRACDTGMLHVYPPFHAQHVHVLHGLYVDSWRVLPVHVRQW
jgi:hypothetical protein